MSNLYLGALLVIGFQITVTALVIGEIRSPGFEVRPPTRYVIILPRALSALLAHLNVEPDIRNGLILMKYCLNHPHKFKEHPKPVENDSEGAGGALAEPEEGKSKKRQDTAMNTKRVFFAFVLGFCQFAISCIVEVCIVYYLSNITNLMDIIMKFAAMTAITRFDNMYAAALFEEKMKKAAKQKLQVEYKRHMGS